jgi:hypothetical protein
VCLTSIVIQHASESTHPLRPYGINTLCGTMGDNAAQSNGGAGFSTDINDIYAVLSDQHRHPQGPWPLMTQRVQDLKLGPGAVVVDLASGMGEPAFTIAKTMPEVCARTARPRRGPALALARKSGLLPCCVYPTVLRSDAHVAPVWCTLLARCMVPFCTPLCVVD